MRFFGKNKKKKTIPGDIATTVPADAPEGSVVPEDGGEVFTVEPVEFKQKVRLDLPSDKVPLKKAAFFIKISLILIAIFLLISSAKLLLDYTRLVEEEQQKREYYDSLQEKIDELNYYIDSPMDEYYVRKFAWEIFRMVPLDKSVVIITGEN